MSQRHNNIQLIGVFEIGEPKVIMMAGKEMFCLQFSVITDKIEFGGRHPCVAYDKAAKECVAFARAYEELRANQTHPLTCLLYGSLRSSECSWSVVTDRVSFYVGPDVRTRAVEILNDMEAQPSGRRGNRR